MTQSFKSADVLLLVAFAIGLAAIDGFSRRDRSSCPQCELDLMQRTAGDHVPVARDHARPPEGSSDVVDIREAAI